MAKIKKETPVGIMDKWILEFKAEERGAKRHNKALAAKLNFGVLCLKRVRSDLVKLEKPRG